jgi:hypothetical protein
LKLIKETIAWTWLVLVGILIPTLDYWDQYSSFISRCWPISIENLGFQNPMFHISFWLLRVLEHDEGVSYFLFVFEKLVGGWLLFVSTTFNINLAKYIFKTETGTQKVQFFCSTFMYIFLFIFLLLRIKKILKSNMPFQLRWNTTQVLALAGIKVPKSQLLILAKC